jgi:hypothetical protein
MTPHTDEARIQAITARALTERVFVLNCYGRGRSGIVWRMIGSSPDVMLTSREWYVGVFGEKKTLRKCLGVRWSEDGKFEFKVKPYGAHRLATVGVEDRAFIRIGAEEASDQIDASVLGGERERLSEAERRAIWNHTGAAATRFGYTASGVLPGVT